MRICSYTPHTTPGPNGRTLRLIQPEDGDRVIELAQIGGRRYVGVPSTSVLPEQPQEIDWREEPEPPAQALTSRWHAYVLAPQLSALASERWTRVAGGMQWSGWPVQTGPADQANILAVYTAARDGIRADGAKFKFGDGIARPLTNAEAIAMAEAVFARVQACYDRESELADALRDGQQSDLSAGWPD